jgi:stage V sporulation protein D (sporulation-specific penicillin-binding protein)
MKWRTTVVQCFFIIWAAILLLRLGYWQIVKASELKSQADLQHSTVSTLPAIRGQILAVDGQPLVSSLENYRLIVDPQTSNLSEVASKILPLLPASDSARLALQNAANSHLSWLSVASGIPYLTEQQISKMNIPGVSFETEPTRVYPEGSSSAYLTGFVGKDDLGNPKGYFGLEGFYDRQLAGKPGRLIQENDAFNRPIVIGDNNRISPQNGHDLVTSIDRTVQFIIESRLSEGLTKYKSPSGTVSIMESKTGRILGMVSLPGYDPENYTNYDQILYKNPIVSEGYEPGSTFKTIVMAAALDTKSVRPDTICEICTGQVKIGEYFIGSWDGKYYPGSTMTDVILHSDNVGMVFVSRKLGNKNLFQYIQRFGFGKNTGVDLEDEASPPLRPEKDWQEIDWATAAFGQGIAVTRLQMLTAVNAIANRGKLIPPTVVSAIKSDSEVKPISPPKTTQVVSPLAAGLITQMMVNGVEHGEVRYYKPAGYLIAGKTGTAQVAIAGHYDAQESIASFIGFAPADDPKFTMLVTLKDPKSSPWGSTTAAPLWFDIARDLFRYYKIPPRE